MSKHHQKQNCDSKQSTRKGNEKRDEMDRVTTHEYLGSITTQDKVTKEFANRVKKQTRICYTPKALKEG